MVVDIINYERPFKILSPTLLVSKFNDEFKSFLRHGLSEPEFYGDLVYKFKKIVEELIFPISLGKSF